jgi:hypothetical protein
MTRRRGRPPVNDGDPSVSVCVTMPSKQYDAYTKRAEYEDVSVPEIIRRDLVPPRTRPPPNKNLKNTRSRREAQH